MVNQEQIASLLPVYNRTDIVMVRGNGAYLFDEAGKQYLDFASGIAVNSLGHCHPHLVESLTKQAQELWHCSNLYRTPGLEKFAERITNHTFADKVFMTNSGTEAVECGIKMIRRFHYANGTPRPRIITVTGSFHGRTLACISAGRSPKAVEGYEPLLEGFDQVPFGDLEAARAAVTPQTGGIMLETIQGEGGIRPQGMEYLQGLRKLADEHGLLLFLDEVQCGIGRTGRMFAFEHYGITPDICSIAKGIGGGFPVGGCLATAHAAKGMTPGSHGGTYGGNPLATSVANAVLDVMLKDGFMECVQKVGDQLKDALQRTMNDFPHVIEEIRGMGLMLGVKTKPRATEIVARLRERGLLTVALASDNIIRFLPPLIITQSHVEEAVRILRDVIANS
ncbi:MAG TPA: aspartate aminotransferase family protein [Rickettsiales bacterium]|nr:aspartate aminotransferase family protein [Rickettsiales bacterium]